MDTLAPRGAAAAHPRGASPFAVRLAWRNLWRNPRRTLVTVAATTLALLTMILAAALFDGFLQGTERKVLDLELGDVQIFAGDYRDNPSLYTRIEDAEAVVRRLEQAGYAASPRLLGGGLGAAGGTSAGVALYGVEVDRDARVSQVHAAIARGAWLDPRDPGGVVIGWRLSRTLGIEPGAELILLSQAADGSTANARYTVRGVLKSISDGLDRGGVYLDAAAFRTLMAVPTGAHKIVVRRPKAVGLDAAAGAIQRLCPGLDVKTWRELSPTLASYLDSARGSMYVMFFIVYVCIGIVILNAMLMAVFERIREFGVMKALGLSPGAVLGLILCETALMTGLSIAIGAALSVPILRYLTHTGLDMGRSAGGSFMGLAFDPVWRAAVSRGTYTGPITLLCAIVAVAVVYPALKAALIRPIEAMTHR